MTSYETWIFVRNPFLLIAQKSLKKFYVVVNEHGSRLKASASHPDIHFLSQRFQPVGEAFKKAYRQWRISEDMQRAATLEISQLLDALSKDKLVYWDASIRAKYGSRGHEYTALMGVGKNAFRNGKKDIRIENVIALGKRLKEFAPLAALQIEVEAYGKLLKEARSKQIGSIKEKRDALQSLREQKDQTCMMLYRNVGRLMDIFYDSPRKITDFFPMELIRKPSKKKPEIVELEEEEQEDWLPEGEE